MISMDKEYRTRDGREARIYATDGKPPFQVHGAVKHNGAWTNESWTLNGSYQDDKCERVSDLIEVKPRIKRDIWMNVYDYGCSSFSDPEVAKNYANPGCLARVKVTIDCEEGEGL